MNVGKVVQVIGPTVDVAFDPEALPKIYNAILIEDAERGIRLTVEAALHVGDNVVRCIAMDSTDGLVRGMKATDTGAPISVPVGQIGLGRIFNLTGDPIDGKGPVHATKKRTSLPSSSRKYSAIVTPVSPTRRRAPGGSFIWPNTITVFAMTPDSVISRYRSLPSRVRSPTPANTE